MGRIPKKTAYWVAKRARAGQLQAELEAHRRKPLEESLKEHIGKALDRTNPLEAGAVVGLALYFYGSMPAIVASVLHINAADVKNELAKVGLSFSLAYIIVHHMGQLALAAADLGKHVLDVATYLIIGAGASAGPIGAIGVIGGTAQTAINVIENWWKESHPLPDWYVTLLPTEFIKGPPPYTVRGPQ
jgi:hypothetical protein